MITEPETQRASQSFEDFIEQFRSALSLDYADKIVELNRLCEALLDYEPFSQLKGKMIRTGNGSIGPRFFIGDWIIKNLSVGRSASEMAAHVRKALKENKAKFAEYQVVLGAEVDQTIELTDLLKVHPASKLDSEQLDDTTFPGHPVNRFGMTIYERNVGHCIIERDYFIDPLIVDEGTEMIDEIEQRDDDFDQVIRAIVLSCSSKIRKGARFEKPIDEFVPYTTTGFSHPNSIDPVFRSSKIDVEMLETSFQRLSSFNEVNAMHLAIDAIMQARKTNNKAEKAFGFGMALEVLLMHGDGNMSDQISYKLSQRAGWLLGNDWASRIDIGKRAKKLYVARSKAVHTGKSTFKNASEVNDAEKLISEIVARLLQLGSFPDWNELTFGRKVE